MTKYKEYYAGESNCQRKVKMVIYRKDDLYKFVLADDADIVYIASKYVDPATATALEETIDEIMHRSTRYESLADICNALQNTFCGRVYLGEKIAPRLTDGILLLSLADDSLSEFKIIERG